MNSRYFCLSQFRAPGGATDGHVSGCAREHEAKQQLAALTQRIEELENLTTMQDGGIRSLQEQIIEKNERIEALEQERAALETGLMSVDGDRHRIQLAHDVLVLQAERLNAELKECYARMTK